MSGLKLLSKGPTWPGPLCTKSIGIAVAVSVSQTEVGEQFFFSSGMNLYITLKLPLFVSIQKQLPITKEARTGSAFLVVLSTNVGFSIILLIIPGKEEDTMRR